MLRHHDMTVSVAATWITSNIKQVDCLIDPQLLAPGKPEGPGSFVL
jgi:hypothetical protein